MNENKDLPLESVSPETAAPETPLESPESREPEQAPRTEPCEAPEEPGTPVPEETPAEPEPTEIPEMPEAAGEAESPDAPPTPPVFDPQPLLEQLLQQNRDMTARLESMEELFRKRIAYTDHEEKVGDRMHKELQRYRDDLYFKLIKPILVDVLEMRDSILRTAAIYGEKPAEQQVIPLKTFANYAYDLQEILEKNGIEIFSSEAGGDYVALRQRVVKKIPTQDPSLHGKVAQVLTEGYLNGDKVLSPEKVAVYIYQEPTTSGSAQ